MLVFRVGSPCRMLCNNHPNHRSLQQRHDVNSKLLHTSHLLGQRPNFQVAQVASFVNTFTYGDDLHITLLPANCVESASMQPNFSWKHRVLLEIPVTGVYKQVDFGKAIYELKSKQ